MLMTMSNILAFFNVVASSQISPHSHFGRQRYTKKLTSKHIGGEIVKCVQIRD